MKTKIYEVEECMFPLTKPNCSNGLQLKAIS